MLQRKRDSLSKTKNMFAIKKRSIVLGSPFLILIVSYLVAVGFGKLIGKWAFIPIILSMWCLAIFFIVTYEDKGFIKKWLKKSKTSLGWVFITLLVALIPLPIFLKHFQHLSSWRIWLPWILIALINPWVEEFYWRGLLITYTKRWASWQSILYTSAVFSAYHISFGVNSEINNGFTLPIVTFIMGFAWAIVSKKTNSLRWVIFAHFIVDFLSLSVPAFLDLFTTDW